MTENNSYKSLVIGFCTCANCGYTDNKFNWHTFFKCPECGCRDYINMIFFLLMVFLLIDNIGVRFVIYAILTIFTSVKATDFLMGRKIKDEF